MTDQPPQQPPAETPPPASRFAFGDHDQIRLLDPNEPWPESLPTANGQPQQPPQSAHATWLPDLLQGIDE